MLILAWMFLANTAVCAWAADTESGAPAPETAPPSTSESQKATARLPEIVVEERSDSMIGIADTSTQGTIGHLELEERPISRPGEVLEAMPGVIVTQHSGDGKANQYWLRGFQLDHGTDLATFWNGIPVNLPSNAHGCGYTDLSFLIPELINKIDYGKGPYYASVGEFGSAGWENIQYFQSLPQGIAKLEFGSWNYERGLLADSVKVGQGNLLGALEIWHTDGPWDVPENYVKYNGILTYSQGDASGGCSLTALGYHGTWNATNQVPDEAVAQGLINRFGTLSPTDGGLTDRYLLQGEYHKADENSVTKLMGYAYYYNMALWNNFDFYLQELPIIPSGPFAGENYSTVYGDQFEQKDTRWTQGFRGTQTYFGHFCGLATENTFGFDFRNDVVHDILNRTYDRNVFLVVRDDSLLITDAAPYFENKVQWLSWFRSIAGFRADLLNGNNTNNYTYASKGPQPADSEDLFRPIPEPKLSLIFGPWAKTEFYLSGGMSYHTDDLRGATTHLDPLSGLSQTVPIGGVVGPVTPCAWVAQTWGAETGVRTSFIPNLQSTLTYWVLKVQSELVFDGDAGTDFPSPDPVFRQGIEWANYYTPTKWLTIDADFADSSAHFYNNGKGEATTASPGIPAEYGPYDPQAARMVVATGVTVHDVCGWSSSLRWRFFGPRYLNDQGTEQSPPTSLLYYNLSYKFNNKWKVQFDMFNVLGVRADDITYYYPYQLKPTGAPVSGFPAVDETVETGTVFHAAEPRTIRVALTYYF